MPGRALYLALALTLIAAPLAGCGKKGQNSVPAGEKSTYPRPYPSGATQNATPSVPGSTPEPNPDAPIPAVPPNAAPSGAVPISPQGQNVSPEQ